MVRLPSHVVGSRLSISRILSYVFDWIIILAFAAVGGAFNSIQPFHRIFSLADTSISYPMRPDTVTVTVMVIVGLIAPGVIIALICLLFVPGPTVPKNTSKLMIWKRKAWELNTGWMGLGMSLAVTFFLTQGSKLLFGRPRPDLLARCDPDLSALQDHIVGGFGPKVPQGQYLVDHTICRQTDQDILNNGFMSFPSGHSSFSWAGLFYLTLFICAKFAIAIPWALPSSSSPTAFIPKPSELSRSTTSSSSNTQQTHHTFTLRTSAAAPPLYLLILAVAPVGAAIYVSSSRYTDYRHHPFDIFVGSLLGAVMAWISFRWFHAPIRRGAGWSWGPRSVGRSWAIGVGVQGYRAEPAPLEGQEEGWKRDDGDAVERGEAGQSTIPGPIGADPAQGRVHTGEAH